MKQIALRLDDEMAAAIDKASEGMPRERWIKQALATALSGPPSVAVPPPERAPEPRPAPSGAREAASSRASAHEAGGAEDGLEGPSFRLTVDQAHAWFREHNGRVSGGYVAW